MREGALSLHRLRRAAGIDNLLRLKEEPAGPLGASNPSPAPAALPGLTKDAAKAAPTATRRLSLAAREGGALALLLRHRARPRRSAAATRWEIAAAPSLSDNYGLGRPRFAL